MKKFLCFILILALPAPQTVFAAPLGDVAGHYLYYNDREIPMTETVIVGHWENMHEETFVRNAVVYDGIVYAPLAAIADCLGLEVTEDGLGGSAENLNSVQE